MQMWEHKIIRFDDEVDAIRTSSYSGTQVDMQALYEDVLDTYGTDGWELVTVLTHPHPRYPDKHVPTAWFKRPVVRSTNIPESTLTPEERVRRLMEEETPPTT